MSMKEQHGFMAVKKFQRIDHRRSQLIPFFVKQRGIMVPIGFPEKAVLFKFEKKVIQVAPLSYNAVKRKLEELLNIPIKNKAIFFR